jgi:hypothetical protein
MEKVIAVMLFISAILTLFLSFLDPTRVFVG